MQIKLFFLNPSMGKEHPGALQRNEIHEMASFIQLCVGASGFFLAFVL